MALDYSMILNKPNVGQQIMQGLQQYQQIQAFEGEKARREQEAQREAEQAQRAAQFRSEFSSAATPQDKAALASQYPEMIEQINSVLQLDQGIKRDVAGEIGMQLSALSGDPEAAASFVKQNSDVLSSLGPAFAPERLMQQIQENPERLAQTADMVTMAALGPEKYQEIVGQRAQMDLKERQFAEVQGQNQFNQGIARQEMGIKQQELGLRQRQLQISAMANQEAALDRQLSRETNALKRMELEDRIAASRVQREQAEQAKQIKGEEVLSTAQRGIETVDAILNSDGFSSAIGLRLPTSYIPGSDAKETLGLIENLQSQVFLSEIEKMKGAGALSDAEGRKLDMSIASLDPTMSEDAFKRSLSTIQNAFKSAQERASREYGVSMPETSGAPRAGAVQDGYRFKGGDPASPESWEKI